MTLRACSASNSAGDSRYRWLRPPSILKTAPSNIVARLTWAVGQIADYLLDLKLGSVPLIVREFADYYEAFMSGVRLGQDVVNLAETNPRAAGYLGSALLGAVVGTAIAKKGEGALIGAGVGLLLAAFVEAMNASPKAVHAQPL